MRIAGFLAKVGQFVVDIAQAAPNQRMTLTGRTGAGRRTGTTP
jgi:hypothetical protein